MALIDHLGLNGHICPIPPPGSFDDPTCEVVLAPIVDEHSSQAERVAYRNFWRNDNICSYVLTGKLSTEIFNSLPPRRGGPHNLPTLTARDILGLLRRRFSIGSAAAAQKLKDSVFCFPCAPRAIPAYVQAWRAAVNQLSDTPWDFTPYERIQKFMDGIPGHPSFNSIRDSVRKSWEHNPLGTYNFFDLADEILDIDIDIRRRNPQHDEKKRRSPPPIHANPTATSNASSLDSTNRRPPDPPVSKDFANNRPRAHVAATDAITESSFQPDSFYIDDDDSTVISASAEDSNDIVLTAYDPSCDKSNDISPYFAFVGSSDPVALASISLRFNSLLDSGCTTHLIRDREFFWSYHPDKATLVGTANCGILSTLAKGE
ncbi:hypothetical protein C0992_009158, partial [Termitomyces sp. T32_za158]